jgi:hypothetical protein
MPVHEPRLAILFWFYDRPEICLNRLGLLRALNPRTPIFGLYGGPPARAAEFSRVLAGGLDDFHAYAAERSSEWKWTNGDLMIAEWFRRRGTALDWDTIVIVQWDMLMLEPVDRLFARLRKDEIFLSSTRPVGEIEHAWHWVKASNRGLRQRYVEFLQHVGRLAAVPPTPLACLFVVVCLPRIFLERYASIADPELGFVEYRVPTYAALFGVPFSKALDFDAWLPGVAGSAAGHRKYLLPVRRLIPLPEIYLQRCKRHGAAIFHPYDRVFRPGLRGFVRDVANLVRDLPAWLMFRLRVLRDA